MANGSTVAPFTAFHAVAHGMNHYYLQRTDCVIHVNHTGFVINRLPVEHIRSLEGAYKEVPLEDYYQAAGEVLSALGFSSEPSIN